LASVLHRAVKETTMEVLYFCCCGWDVHKNSITVCVLWAEAKGPVRKQKSRAGSGRLHQSG